MNHIDEGTIHAWLDGALDAERAREVEAHVAQCADCSAAVAEARGLIAGASRILTALDDVPANVTPKRAPSAAPLKRQRQWRAAPWVTGIAAALMLAIGITTWNQSGSRAMRSQVSAPTSEADAASAVPEAAQSLADTAGPGLAAGARPAGGTPSSAGTAAGPGGTASGGRVSGLAASGGTRGTQSKTASQLAQAPRAVSATSAPGTSGGFQRNPAAREEKLTVSQPEVAPPASSAIARGRVLGVAVDSAAERRQVTDFAVASPETTRLPTADTTRLRRTSAFDTTRRRRLGEGAMLNAVVVTSIGADVARDSAATRQAAGCYQLARVEDRASVAKLTERVAAAAAPPSDASRSAAREQLARTDVGTPRLPARVRLDTTQNRAGLMVRDGSTDAYIGTWQRQGRDSVRVILPGQGAIVVTAKDRVSCPER